MVSKGYIDEIPVGDPWARAVFYTGTILIELSLATTLAGMCVRVCVCACDGGKCAYEVFEVLVRPSPCRESFFSLPALFPRGGLVSPSICLYDDEFSPSFGFFVLAAELACIGIVGFGEDSTSTVRARVQSLECRPREISRRLRRLIPQSSGDTHTPMVARGHIDKIPVERQWARALIYAGTILVERLPASSYDKGMRM